MVRQRSTVRWGVPLVGPMVPSVLVLGVVLVRLGWCLLLRLGTVPLGQPVVRDVTLPLHRTVTMGRFGQQVSLLGSVGRNGSDNFLPFIPALMRVRERFLVFLVLVRLLLEVRRVVREVRRFLVVVPALVLLLPFLA